MKNEEVKKEKKVEPYFKIVEMKDSIEESISNLNKVIESQNGLIEYLKKAPNNEFKDTVIELIQSNENFKLQVKTLEDKLQKITNILNKCDEDEEYKKFFNLTMSTFLRNL